MPENEVVDDFSDERKFALLNHIDSLLIRFERAISFLKFAIVVVIVLLIGSLLRSFVVQDQVDDVGEAAKDAKDAATSASNTSVEGRDASVDVQRTLNEILSQLEASSAEPGLNDEAINEALLAIARIEGFLCGGECPESG